MSKPTASTAEAIHQKPPQAGIEQHASARHPVDKFAAARIAKKKQKRLRHRARLKRSNTDG